MHVESCADRDAVGRVVADSVPVQNPVLGWLLPSKVPSSPAAEAVKAAYRDRVDGTSEPAKVSKAKVSGPLMNGSESAWST